MMILNIDGKLTFISCSMREMYETLNYELDDLRLVKGT